MCLTQASLLTFVVLTVNTFNSSQWTHNMKKTTTTAKQRGSLVARPKHCGRSVTYLCYSSSWPLAFLCCQKSNLIKNQPIHDQLLLYCLVKWKYSRGTVDKKELKAILEIDCRPRRYIFPHKPGLRTEVWLCGIYTGRHVTRSFPGFANQSGKRNMRRVCSRVTQWSKTWILSHHASSSILVCICQCSKIHISCNSLWRQRYHITDMYLV